MFEKVNRSLKYDSIFFSSTNIYIYIWTSRPITLPRSRCACRVMKYNSCIFMVKLRNSFFRKQNSTQQCDEMLSTFMKITRVNKLKNKIINYSPLFKSLQPTLNKLLYELKCLAISFVFVEMTPFGAVKA